MPELAWLLLFAILPMSQPTRFTAIENKIYVCIRASNLHINIVMITAVLHTLAPVDFSITRLGSERAG
jgi:hypothetical protein